MKSKIILLLGIVSVTIFGLACDSGDRSGQDKGVVGSDTTISKDTIVKHDTTILYDTVTRDTIVERESEQRKEERDGSDTLGNGGDRGGVFESDTAKKDTSDDDGGFFGTDKAKKDLDTLIKRDTIVR